MLYTQDFQHFFIVEADFYHMFKKNHCGVKAPVVGIQECGVKRMWCQQPISAD